MVDSDNPYAASTTFASDEDAVTDQRGAFAMFVIGGVSITVGFVAFAFTVFVLLKFCFFVFGSSSGFGYFAAFGLGTLVVPVAALMTRQLLLQATSQPIDDEQFLGHSRPASEE